MELKAWIKQARIDLESQFPEREIEGYLQRLAEKYLNYNRAQMVLNATEQIMPDLLDLLNESISKLKQFMPIDYILEESYFFGHSFYVDESVLIPRSETEELVLLVLDREQDTEISLLDIGTGSGCIPIALALERSYRQVDACEVSIPALEVAIKNGELLQAKVSWFLLDILTQSPAKKYNVLISNPPYVKPEELKKLDKNVIEYEPVIALAPESDPLEFYKRMIHIVDEILEPGGRLYWEIHEDLGAEVMALLDLPIFSGQELIQDMYGRDRFVRALYTP